MFYILGTLLAMQIPFVGFQALHSSEHMASHAVFILINFLNFFSWIRNFVSKKAIITLTKFLVVFLVFSIVIGVVILTLAGKT